MKMVCWGVGQRGMVFFVAALVKGDISVEDDGVAVVVVVVVVVVYQ